MRVRSRLHTEPFLGDYLSGYNSINVPTSQETPWPVAGKVSTYGTSLELGDLCIDELMPGYFKAKREGKLLSNHPLTIQKTDALSEGVSALVRFKRDIPIGNIGGKPYSTKRKGIIELKSCFPALPTFPEQSFPRDQIVQEALANMRSELWDVGTLMAEAGKTAALVNGAKARTVARMETILGVMSRYGRWRDRDLRELLDQFSSLWMEYRYGWRLLYYDLESAQEAYQRISEKISVVYKRYTVSANLSGSISTSWSPVGSTPFDVRWTQNYDSLGRGGVMGHIDLEAPISVDPIVTTWEVIPFSFIADWFFNVGEALQAWSPLAAGKLDHAFFSQETTALAQCEIRVRPTYTWDGQPWNTVVESIQLDSNAFVVRNRKSRVPQTPSFDLSFRLNFGGAKWFDAAALTWLLRRRLMAIARVTRI